MLISIFKSEDMTSKVIQSNGILVQTHLSLAEARQTMCYLLIMFPYGRILYDLF